MEALYVALEKELSTVDDDPLKVMAELDVRITIVSVEAV